MQEVACERSCERKQVVEAPISTDMASIRASAKKERGSHERVRAILGGTALKAIRARSGHAPCSSDAPSLTSLTAPIWSRPRRPPAMGKQESSHPSPSSSDTIELREFEDVLVTPDPDHVHRHPYRQSSLIPEEPEGSDDEDNSLDEGERALLGQGRRTGRRMTSRSPSRPSHGTWAQVKNLVVEVCSDTATMT